MNTVKRARATIDDVAQMAGVSVTTVSRVLNDARYVRGSTKQKVHAAVKALNYSPNMQARGLAGEKSGVIGLFFDDPRGDYVADLLRGALLACAANGYHLVVEIRDDQNPGDRDPKHIGADAQIHSFLSRLRPDGVILTPPICEDSRVVEALAERGVPMVLIAATTGAAQAVTVKIDEAQAAFEMTEHLISKGHREIGFIKGDPAHSSAAAREEGFRAALQAHSVPVRPELIVQGNFSFESGARCARQLLAGPIRPTAIFASNDEMAAGVLSAAHEAGISVPRDLSVAGFDDGSIASWVCPALSTVRQPVYDMAVAAVEFLVALGKGEVSLDQPEMILRHERVERASVAPPSR